MLEKNDSNYRVINDRITLRESVKRNNYTDEIFLNKLNRISLYFKQTRTSSLLLLRVFCNLQGYDQKRNFSY